MAGQINIHAQADAATRSCCPRCGAGFRCGASDAAPCACAGVEVDDAARAALRTRYVGCLCLDCLQQVVAANERAGPVSRPAGSTEAP